MGKKKTADKQAAAPAQESAAAEAKKAALQAKQEERMASYFRKQEKMYDRYLLVAGIVLFFLVCIPMTGNNKILGFLAAAGALAVLVAKRRCVAERFTVPVLLVVLYCAVLFLSGFYAPSGKFALTELMKVFTGLSVFLAVLAFEPERSRLVGRCGATAAEAVAAAISLVSIDFTSARLLSTVVLRFLGVFTDYYDDIEAVVNGRANSIIGNLNVFAGMSGLGVLLALGLLSGERERNARRVHLVCLCMNAISFVISLSRGAMLALTAAFIVYLLLERGEARVRAFITMVEALVFAGAGAMICLVTGFGLNGGTRFVPLSAAILCAAGLVAADELIGQRLAEKFKDRAKLMTVGIVVVLGLLALFAAAAFNLTGAATISSGDTLYRAGYPAAGENTLHVRADGALNVDIINQADAKSFTGVREAIYSGAADGAVFTVPDDSAVVFFFFSPAEGETAVTIDEARYEGETSGSIKLDYLLLPGGVETNIQGVLQGESFQLRRILWSVGATLWKQSPVIGQGVGVFENKAANLLGFHYETKYVHCHYLELLLETGVIGLAVFLAMLVSLAAVILRARRREESNPLLAALGACLFFAAAQAITDIIFNYHAYLLLIFVVFGLIVVCGGGELSFRGEKAKRWSLRGTGAVLAVWIVLTALNLAANLATAVPTYDSLVTAAKMDFYEKNDYKLSYALNASREEERNDEMTRQMYDYLRELEGVPSNSIPIYLAESYFRLGEVDQAFDMLKKYTDYVISDGEKWDTAYRLAIGYYDETDHYTQKLAELYQSMLEWNKTSLQPIEPAEDVHGFITSVTGME